MAESLGHVAEELACLWVDLFAVEADVVCEREQLLQERGCFVGLPGPRQRFGEPEGTGDKRALCSRDAVATRVAANERAVCEFARDRLDGCSHSLVSGLAVPVQDAEQKAGVEFVAVSGACVALFAGRPAVRIDVIADRLAFRLPAGCILAGQDALLCELECAVEGNRAEHLRQERILPGKNAT